MNPQLLKVAAATRALSRRRHDLPDLTAADAAVRPCTRCGALTYASAPCPTPHDTYVGAP